LPMCAAAGGGQIHLHGREFLEVVAEAFDHGADGIILADGRAEEAKLGGFTRTNARLLIWDDGSGPLLHSKGRDRECLEWIRESGNGGHGCFDTNVIGSRHATADAPSPAPSRQAVVGGAARHSVH